MQPFSFPGFELLEKIGQGGMATVWKARQLSLDRLVAIKVLSPRTAGDPADVERFHTECKSAAMLKHPGIVQVYDASVHEGLYCLVMEFVAGESLGSRIRRKQRLSEEEVLFVLEHVARALDHAWKTAGLIHCDIKPDNILIDADGSVKVTDLGLATTLGAMAAMAQSEEIMGTPHFMSPEQISGQSALDCRTDIYSMGASLYQMLTGRMLFEGASEDAVLEKQLKDRVHDVMDVVPTLSSRIAWLVEKMLARKPADRHADWSAVAADAERLMRKQFPAPPLPPPGASTMARSRRRLKPPAHPAADTTPPPPSGAPASDRLIRALVLLGILTALGAIAFFVVREVLDDDSAPARHTAARPPETLSRPPEPAPPAPLRDAQAADMFAFAGAWRRDNPDQFDAAITHFQKVAQETKGTRFSLMADEEIGLIRRARDAALKDILESLRKEADKHAAAKRFTEAARVLESYSNRLAAETRETRLAEAARYRDRAAQERANHENQLRLARRARDAAFAGAADAMLQNRPHQALDLLLATDRLPDLVPLRESLAPVIEWVRQAAFPDKRIADSFTAQVNQDVVVQLVSGPRALAVQEVRDGVVLGLQRIAAGNGAAAASVQIRFALQELAPAERLQRIGPDAEPAAALYKGGLAAEARDLARARALFQNVPGEFGAALGAALDRLEEAAPIAAQPAAAPAAAPAPAEFLHADAFREQLTAVNPALYPHEIHVEADADGRVHKVVVQSLALKNLEPFRKIANTLVELAIPQNQAANLAPLSALPALTRLDLAGSAIADLTPLRGLKLAALNLNNTRARDLAPLRGLPLQELELAESKAFSFDPLRTLKLTRLNLANTTFNDLTLLRDMPLRDLNVSGSKVYDFTPIRRHQLLSLQAADTAFRDAALLADMPLRDLDLANTKITDITALRRLPLVALNIAGTSVRDLTALRDLATLRRLRFDQCRLRDLTPLAGIPLEFLACNGSQVDDLEPLRQMRLTEFEAANTPVASLQPLQRMPLQRVILSQTKVTDLTPLRDSPIKELHVQGIRPEALMALRGAPVEILYADMPRGPMAFDIIRLFPKLRETNGQPLMFRRLP